MLSRCEDLSNLAVKMPDYLGKDQRKTHDDDEKEDAPIKGNFDMFQSFERNGI